MKKCAVARCFAASCLNLYACSPIFAQTFADVHLCVSRPLSPGDCDPNGPPVSPNTFILVNPSQTFYWNLRVTIVGADGRSFGLAGFVCDLVCRSAPPNTEAMVLSGMEVGSVPAAMANFSRPLGISNKPAPGSGLTTGYVGTRMLRPDDSLPALVQIGGAQNTFGVAGTNIGQVHVVTTGVSMGIYGQVVASGTITLTGGAANYGFYTFGLDNVAVNALATEPVVGTLTRSAAIPPYVGPDVTVTFLCQADFNGSGSVTIQDVFDFLAAFFDNQASADVNLSGDLTVQDVFDFLALFFAGC
jgi:hypothetical protein